MSNEKNIQAQVDAEKKKEHVSVLERIRRRTGLLVGIVGLALVIFILESLLGSGKSIFGGDEMSNVGSINGKKIDRNEFAMRMENQLNSYRQRNQSNDVDDNTRAQVIETVWQQYVVDMVIKPQFDKAGIVVGEDELYDRVVANPVQSIVQNLSDQNGKLNEQFARPDGSLDLGKWKQAVQSVTGDQEMAVRQMEDQVKNTRYFEKYRMLINKGLYVTKAEAKETFKAQTSKISLSYVIKRFDSVSDSAVKVTDSEIQKYYNDHSYEFMNPETTRSIEYVAFDVVPSQEDLTAVGKDAQRAADDFKGKSIKDDSTFIVQESENGNLKMGTFTKKTMIVRDSSIFTSPVGTVFGPYNEGAYFKIYKLESVTSMADSAKIRHILIGMNDPRTQQPKRTKEQAKREADSLLVLIKDKKVTFDTLVKTMSDDMGSIDKGGNYGWFDEKKGFVEPYTNAGLMGVKGNISVVETPFGYHIIEVLDVSKTRHNSYRVGEIFKLISPSDETNQAIFAKANQFGGEHNNGDLFDKAVETQKLTKRMGENIKEGDRQVAALDQAKELVRWVYTAKKGDVAVFTFTDKHIVAKVSGIKNKGTLPLEEVKNEVAMKARQEKKAAMFIEEFKNKAGSSKDVNDIASKLGAEVKTIEIPASDHNIEGVGHDDIMIGTILGTKAGATSRPTAGDNGVFVISVSAVKTESEPKDYAMFQQQAERALTGRTDYDSFNALKEISDIEDHKARVD